MNIEESAKQAGMNVSMWNYGAGSIVFTMGTDGVARGALERFAKIIRNQAMEDAAACCDELPAPESCNQVERSLWDVATVSAGDAIRSMKNG